MRILLNMKIALSKWNNRIAPVFDYSRTIEIIEIGDHTQKVVTKVTFSAEKIHHLLEKLEKSNVDYLLCGAISCRLFNKLSAREIQIISFIAGDIQEILTAFLKGNIPNLSYTMPGCFPDAIKKSNRKRRRLRVSEKEN
ncbi:NifB/NifX family molybdenum-iron cluster-binding protein [Candidatus Riflebacteria bacterium]